MGIERLRSLFDVSVFAVLSYGDEENKNLCKLYNAEKYIEVDNEPLGKKMNQGLNVAMDCEFEYLMQLGSDDLITNEGMRELTKKMDEGDPFFGFNKLVMLDTNTGRSKEKFYGNVFGAGRCMSKEMLETVLYHRALWDDDRVRGMDVNSEKTIEKCGYPLGATPLNLKDWHILDCKSDENIWAYDYFAGCTDLDTNEVLKRFSKSEREYIKELYEGRKIRQEIRN